MVGIPGAQKFRWSTRGTKLWPRWRAMGVMENVNPDLEPLNWA